MGWWQKIRNDYQTLIAEYGPIALGTYLAIALLSFTGFVIAIHLGFVVDGVASGAGTFLAAWAGIKLLQPLRIAATLLLTPFVARMLRRRRNIDRQ